MEDKINFNRRKKYPEIGRNEEPDGEHVRFRPQIIISSRKQSQSISLIYWDSLQNEA